MTAVMHVGQEHILLLLQQGVLGLTAFNWATLVRYE
jgi:hypothetical protein